ncbi:hypothetical protein [Paracoccus sp. SY]|uniref:hypothetical protein n=1 Tax=Paracoccus sp. SY TaxID=1330255 RepID=UPI000CD2FBBF|nr:hypothetical protein [Paracoccus sp. SY]
MALKAIIDSLDSVEEQHRSLYEEKDGKYVLAIEGLEAHPGAAALKSALDRVRSEKRALSEKLTGAEARLTGLPDDFDADEYDRLRAAAEGKEPPALDERLERQRTELEKKHGAEKAKLEGRIAKLDGTLRKTLVDDGLTKALIDAGVSKDFLPAAKALLKERGAVKLIEEDDEFQVLADNGIDDRMPLAKFVTDWAADEGKHFVAKPTGGDAKGGDAKRFTDNPFDPKNPNRTKQQELIIANDAKARQMAEAVGVKPYW